MSAACGMMLGVTAQLPSPSVTGGFVHKLFADEVGVTEDPQLHYERWQWGGRLPSKRLRGVRGSNVLGLLTFDSDLVHCRGTRRPAFSGIAQGWQRGRHSGQRGGRLRVGVRLWSAGHGVGGLGAVPVQAQDGGVVLGRAAFVGVGDRTDKRAYDLAGVVVGGLA